MRSNTTIQWFSLVWLSAAVAGALLWMTGCGRHTSLVIEPGSTIRFIVSGPGTMTNFQVSGPDLEREPNRQGKSDRLTMLKVYWEVASTDGIALDKIAPITYGKVPEGFVQVQPPNGAPPPLLVERDLYNVRFLVNDGGWN